MLTKVALFEGRRCTDNLAILRHIRDNARKDGCSCNLQTRQEGSELRIPLDKADQLPCMNVGRILLPELWRQARSVGCMREMRER